MPGMHMTQCLKPSS